MQIFRAFGLVLLSFTFLASHAAAAGVDERAKDAPKTETITKQLQQQQLVESVDFEGNRRFRSEDLLYYIKTRANDVYNPQQLELDFRQLLTLDAFDKAESKVLTEEGDRGVKVIFHVEELPVIRDLQFKGLKAVPESDILKAFREQRVKISKESTYNPVNAQRGIRVIREALASKGYPNATVTVTTEEVSKTSTAITYNVEQGNRSRIVDIEFEGNEIFKNSELRNQLQLVKQTGLISRVKGEDILDLRKLQYDLQKNVRQYMFSKGYFQARIGDPQVVGLGYKRTGFVPFFTIPLPVVSSKDDTLKIIVPVTEGKLFRVGDVKVEGNSIFSEQAILSVAGLKKGEVVEGKQLLKGLQEDLPKLYGTQGFVQATAEPETTFKDNPNNPKEGIVDVTVNIDEGKQFRLRQLEFSGNTFTRDQVLRREVLINEGDIYNQSLLEISVARLNQLGFFDPVDKDKDVTIRTDEESGDLDLVVAVKEKGRQQISFNGGISGIGGTSFGLQYSTNNLLGRGEVFSFSANLGNRQTSFEVTFQEPYFRNRPIQVGVSLFLQRYKFFGEGTTLTQNADAVNNYINSTYYGNVATDASNLFTQNTYGATVFATAPLSELFFKKRRFTQFSRLGLTYGITATTVKDPPVNSSNDPTKFIPVVFATPNIITSSITPSFVYDFRPRNNGIDTIQGRQLSFTVGLAGLGGDVRTYQPAASYTQFIPVRHKRSKNPEVFGFRLQAGTIGSFAATNKILNSNSLSFINGVPFYQRYFLGSENDLRGYDTRSIGPIAPVDGYITTRNVVVADNATGTPTTSAGLTDAQRSLLTSIGTFTGPGGSNPLLTSRSYRIIGGDSELLGNFEYRIPIFGPVSLAAFADIGTVFNLRSGGNQTINSNFLPDQPFLGQSSIGNLILFNPTNVSPYQQTILGGFILRNGDPVTKTDFLQTYCANDPTQCPATLPTDLTQVFLRGDAQTNTIIRTGDSVFGKFGDFRSSVGLELRVQVPVVNVPFRLIYYFNPNGKFGYTNELPGLYLPGKRNGLRFSVGRTF